jgi:Na+/H+-dicarboxylate symporter
MYKKKGGKSMLRVAWILPNIFLYVAFIFLTYFIMSNYSGLKELNNLGIWIIISVLVLVVAVFGSYKIVVWIRDGKI